MKKMFALIAVALLVVGCEKKTATTTIDTTKVDTTLVDSSNVDTVAVDTTNK